MGKPKNNEISKRPMKSWKKASQLKRVYLAQI